MLIPDPSDMLKPSDRISWPIIVPISYDSTGSHAAAIASAEGSAVEYRPFVPAPEMPSTQSDICRSGIPSRGTPGMNPIVVMARVAGPDSGCIMSACQPSPCSIWIFSSSVSSLITKSARTSGDNVLSDQG